MEEQLNQKKRVREDSSESYSPGSPEAKRIRENLLVLLDEPDTAPSCGVAGSDSRELHSVMKSFEDELAGLAASCAPAVADPVSYPGGSHPELGFLLGASDDELGLPCSTPPPPQHPEDGCAVELLGVSSESSVIGGELWQFEDELSSYDDSFGFGIVGSSAADGGNDYVALDGIFHYSDVTFEPSDYADNTWRRRETLPAQ